MLERRLDFERLDVRDLCAIVSVGTDSEATTERHVVPVTIDDTSGIRAAEVRLKYDPAAWSVDPSAIRTGDAWVSGGAALAKVDATAGEITVFVFATNELPRDQGNLIHVELSPQDPAAVAPPVVELQAVRLNEGAIAAEIPAASSEAAMTREVDPSEDYINPRVREKLTAFSSVPTDVTTAAVTSPSLKDGAASAGEPPRLFRDRFAPIGPFPLTQAENTQQATSIATQDASTAVRKDVVRPSTPWFLLLADEDARLRKRAA